jgi:hypothetical protein
MPRETTPIPTTSPGCLGAAAFLAVLAYPSDLRGRDRVVRAIRALVIRPYRAQMERAGQMTERARALLVSRRERDESTLATTWSRIATRRLPALKIYAGTINPDAPVAYRQAEVDGYSPSVAFVRYGQAFAVVPVLPRPDRADGKSRARKATISAFADLVATELGWSRPNVLRRVWTETLPVLHLAWSLRSTLSKLYPHGGFDPREFVLRADEWLEDSLLNAERIRSTGVLPIAEAETVSLLPESRRPSP